MIFICFLRKSNTTNDESSSAFLQTNTISTQFSIFTISIQYFLSNQTEKRNPKPNPTQSL